MRMKKTILSLFTAVMLYSCAGCSDSEGVLGTEPDPTPTPEVGGSYATTDMVIYEANPRIFATENAFAPFRPTSTTSKAWEPRCSG